MKFLVVISKVAAVAAAEAAGARATDLPSASSKQPEEPFKLAGLNVARFLSGLGAFVALDMLEQKLEQGKMVSRWLGEFGQCFHLSGKPVRQKTLAVNDLVQLSLRFLMLLPPTRRKNTLLL